MTDQILFETGPSKKRLIIRLGDYEENRFIDVRYWYYDRSKGEFAPQRKGISLNRDNYLETLRILNEKNETILDWLDVSYVPEHIKKYTEAQERAIVNARYQPAAVKRKFVHDMRDKSFFAISHFGGMDEIIYNGSHPFLKELQQIDFENPEVKIYRNLIDALLISYYRAKHMFENSPSAHPSILFENLELTWSEFLKKSLEGK